MALRRARSAADAIAEIDRAIARLSEVAHKSYSREVLRDAAIDQSLKNLANVATSAIKRARDESAIAGPFTGLYATINGVSWQQRVAIAMKAAQQSLGRDISKAEIRVELGSMTPAGLAKYVSDRIRATVRTPLTRIAETEAYASAKEAWLNSFAAQGIHAVQWVTTSAKPCKRCIALRDTDYYGLGAGVYPIDRLPRPPHPHCKCKLVPVHVNREPVDKAKLRDTKPVLPSDTTRDDATRTRDELRTLLRDAPNVQPIAKDESAPGLRIDARAPTGDEIHGVYAKGIFRNEHVELVPVSEVARFREFAREARPGLNEDIARNGIREPLIIQYSKTERTALLIEGNHRLDEAIRLGHTHVPVVVQRRDSPFPVRPAPDRAHRPVSVPGYGAGRVPEELRASEIGIRGGFRIDRGAKDLKAIGKAATARPESGAPTSAASREADPVYRDVRQLESIDWTREAIKSLTAGTSGKRMPDLQSVREKARQMFVDALQRLGKNVRLRSTSFDDPEPDIDGAHATYNFVDQVMRVNRETTDHFDRWLAGDRSGASWRGLQTIIHEMHHAASGYGAWIAQNVNAFASFGPSTREAGRRLEESMVEHLSRRVTVAMSGGDTRVAAHLEAVGSYPTEIPIARMIERRVGGARLMALYHEGALVPRIRGFVAAMDDVFAALVDSAELSAEDRAEALATWAKMKEGQKIDAASKGKLLWALDTAGSAAEIAERLADYGFLT